MKAVIRRTDITIGPIEIGQKDKQDNKILHRTLNIE